MKPAFCLSESITCVEWGAKRVYERKSSEDRGIILLSSVLLSPKLIQMSWARCFTFVFHLRFLLILSVDNTVVINRLKRPDYGKGKFQDGCVRSDHHSEWFQACLSLISTDGCWSWGFHYEAELMNWGDEWWQWCYNDNDGHYDVDNN